MKRIAIIPLILVLVLTAEAQQLAFPGAEGFGRYAVGGRGGQVIEVTNLNDSGPNTLRAAVEASGPRTVIFRVSGTIALLSTLRINNPYITIAGQTAPGDGICLKNCELRIEADHVIIRYMRFRLGDDEGAEHDSLSVTGGRNIIIDHCSASWGVDETLSVTCTPDVLGNVTIQWCMITESLNCSIHEKGCHGYGSLIRGGWGNGYTYHHNLYAHHSGRNPRPGNYNGHLEYQDPDGLIFDFRNNVVYNWGGWKAGNNEDSNSITRMNFIGNYYKRGSNSTGSYAFSEKCTYDRAYFSGNWMSSYGGYPADPWSLVQFGSAFTPALIAAFKLSSPIPVEPVTTDDAVTAYNLVLADAGASFPQRDTVDVNIINDVIMGTGEIIDCVECDDFYFPTGYAQAATLNTITLENDASDYDGRYDGWEIEILDGTGSEQIRTISDYNGDTRVATVSENWDTIPDATSVYGVIVDCTKNAGGYPVLESTTPPADTDHDGMPDYWELALCLDPLDPADRNDDRDGDGYTNIEEYINWLPTGEPMPVIFVDEAATGANDGSNWDDAYTSLQDALAVAQAGKNIAVAQGTYKPAGPGGQRTATFQLINGVAIYGGYAGFDEPDPNMRNITIYQTILSGDLNGNDVQGLDPCDLLDHPSRAENSYHVVTGSGTDANAVLDGFTITAGNANGSYPRDRGSGMYNNSGSPTVTNCRFRGNSGVYGGGMYNYDGSSPTLTNCTFSGNTGYWYGGGIDNDGGSPTVTNCAFSGNSAAWYGGGMSNSTDSKPVVTNCTFSGNDANSGGGMYNYNNSPTLTNCTFSDNTASNGGGMCNSYNSNSTVTNCILWGNTAGTDGNEIALEYSSSIDVNYCNIEGGQAAIYNDGTATIIWGTNIDADPMFVRDPNDGGDGWGVGNNDDFGDLHLVPGFPGSPCIDTGDPCGVYDGQTDIDGDPRVSNGRVDMGSDEVIWDGAENIAPEDPPVTLNPGGGPNDPNVEALVVFDNNSLADANVTVVEMSSNPHPQAGFFKAFGSVLRVDTSLADGEFFMTVMIPFDANDLAGKELDDIDLRYYDSGSGGWRLAVENNTQPSPGHEPSVVGDRDQVEGTTPPTLSTELGDYGIYWNPSTEKGFVWANVDHTTDFSIVVLGMPDFEPDGDVDFADFAVFAAHWRDSDCHACAGADLTGDGNVGWYDLKEFTDNWLAGK